MKKKQFRIVTIKRGFSNLYKAQVKTWFGWRNIYGLCEGIIWYESERSPYKSVAYDSIEIYRKLHSLQKDEIEITEIIK